MEDCSTHSRSEAETWNCWPNTTAGGGGVEIVSEEVKPGRLGRVGPLAAGAVGLAEGSALAGSFGRPALVETPDHHAGVGIMPMTSRWWFFLVLKQTAREIK